jgi:hypothetical protein
LFLTRNSKLPSTSTECVIIRPPDIPERIPIRSRTSSGQQHILSTERIPTRNTPATSSVRIPSTSSDKISTNKFPNQLDFEVDRSPLLNHSIQKDKTQIAKTRPRNLPSKRLSNPLLDESANHQNDNADIKPANTKKPSIEQTIETTSMIINKILLNMLSLERQIRMRLKRAIQLMRILPKPKRISVEFTISFLAIYFLQHLTFPIKLNFRSLLEDHSRAQRWNMSVFLMTGSGRSRSARTEPVPSLIGLACLPSFG